MKESDSKITSFITLVVFCIFAVCILLVLLTGADVYNRLVNRQQEHFQERTVSQYISTRTHQADTAKAVWVEDFKGQSSLVIHEELDGEQYTTRIYCFDGYLRELFTPADGNWSPEDGEKILKIQELTFDLQGSVLTAKILLSDDIYQEKVIHLRTKTEGIP